MIGPQESGVLFIAWRCLYAATVHARVENKAIRLDVALRRCLKDVVRRLTAYGEAWVHWSATHRLTRNTNIVPAKLRDKGVIRIKGGGTTYMPSCTCGFTASPVGPHGVRAAVSGQPLGRL